MRQTLRTSHESYSLKDVRQFFMDNAGEGDVASAMDSIVEFEQWRETRDQTLLDAIERYNEEDCVSTLRLRDWLLERKVEAQARFGAIPWRPVPEKPQIRSAIRRTPTRCSGKAFCSRLTSSKPSPGAFSRAFSTITAGKTSPSGGRTSIASNHR